MVSSLPEVIQSLQDPRSYPHPTTRIKLIQTQMSLVFLTGRYVYKLKKPVNLGYLDYTTLEKRRFFCEQEVRLNRRLCPQMYLGVVPVTRRKSGIFVSGRGEVIDYAVKMYYLPQEKMLNVLLERNRATAEMMDRIAQQLADFHAGAETSPLISTSGSVEAVHSNTDENFAQTRPYIDRTITAKQFKVIREFTEKTLEQKADLFTHRVAQGRVRDCHGDLHSRNICVADGICIYDCIEFNDRFRYSDVASDIAFLAMDLDHYGREDLSRCLTRAYLQASQDFQIKEILKFYQAYRAFVRGKVNSFLLDDPYLLPDEKQAALEEARYYFELAESYSHSRPVLFITVGLVGSGKSTLARALARRWSSTIISSDVVRKQLAAVPVTEHRFDEIDSGIYSTEFTRRTYDQLYSRARELLGEGESVILDASFIKSDERRRSRELASEMQADIIALECILDENLTRKRLEERMNHTSVSDGRWEVFVEQKKKFEPLTDFPADRHFIIDSSLPLNPQITRVINSL